MGFRRQVLVRWRNLFIQSACHITLSEDRGCSMERAQSTERHSTEREEAPAGRDFIHASFLLI